MTKQPLLILASCLVSFVAYGQIPQTPKLSLGGSSPDFMLNLPLDFSASAPLGLEMDEPDTSLAPLQPSALADIATRKKRPVNALLLSVGATAGGLALGYVLAGYQGAVGSAGFALGFATIAVGPSVGHLYAGDYKHARRMSIARTVATGLTVLTVLCDFNGNCPSEITGVDLGVPVLLAGAISVPGLILYDFVDSGFAVRRVEGRPVRARLSRAQ